MSTPTPDPGAFVSEAARFRRDGYVVAPRLFGAADLAPIDDCIRELTRDALKHPDLGGIMQLEPESAGGEPAVRRIRDPFVRHEAFRRLATDARLLDRVAALLGPDLAIQHSKLNMKPARVGSAVEWHQDLPYFPHTNDDLLAALIYLDDASEENGCLQVLPRQHRRVFSHELPDGACAGMITEAIADGRHGAPVPLPAPAGSGILMHCLTPHASLPNRSSTPRRTLIFGFRAADAFTIYFSERVVEVERCAAHVRGQQARVARLAGPPPPIPRLGAGVKSLYDIQRAAKRA